MCGRIQTVMASCRWPAINPLQNKQESPDLYACFSTQASHYLRAGAEAHYGRRLAATGADVDGIDVREVTLADLTGDALADPEFLVTLATNNPTKFGQFLHTVVTWLKTVAQKLSNAGFNSSRYFDEL